MFDSASIGDKVYITDSISYGWHMAKSFEVPKKITRTTKTLIVVGERRFKKVDGREVGVSFSYAKKEGKDESSARNEFIALVKIRNEVYKYTNSCPSIETPLPKLKELLKLLKEVFGDLKK